MKLLHKRILTLFSVALNIGFVVVALTLVYLHSKPHDDRSWSELTGIVQRLDLPESQFRAALDSIRKFRSSMQDLDKDLRQARGNILRLLSRKGPVDPDELHRLIEVTDRYNRLKGERFETHVLGLRRLLGDERGAQFFTLLQQQLEKKGKNPHR